LLAFEKIDVEFEEGLPVLLVLVFVYSNFGRIVEDLEHELLIVGKLLLKLLYLLLIVL